MITETSSKKELLTEVDTTAKQLLNLVRTVEENKFNIVPYEGSWTAGQLIRHVSKSTAGIAKALSRKGELAQRNAGEKISLLRDTFMNFSTRLQAPDFIIPEEKIYNKEVSIEELENAFEQFNANANSADVNEIIEGLPMGTVTKLELIHFIIYHTKRHLHQLEKISKALQEKIVN